MQENVDSLFVFYRRMLLNVFAPPNILEMSANFRTVSATNVLLVSMRENASIKRGHLPVSVLRGTVEHSAI